MKKPKKQKTKKLAISEVRCNCVPDDICDNCRAEELEQERDVLRAEVADLKARLKAARDCWFGDFPQQGEDWDEALKRVTDLRVKNWRKP